MSLAHFRFPPFFAKHRQLWSSLAFGPRRCAGQTPRLHTLPLHSLNHTPGPRCCTPPLPTDPFATAPRVTTSPPPPPFAPLQRIIARCNPRPRTLSRDGAEQVEFLRACLLACLFKGPHRPLRSHERKHSSATLSHHAFGRAPRQRAEQAPSHLDTRTHTQHTFPPRVLALHSRKRQLPLQPFRTSVAARSQDTPEDLTESPLILSPTRSRSRGPPATIDALLAPRPPRRLMQ